MDHQASGDTVVIVGAGQAGGEVATSLRQNQFRGRILLIGDEPHLPYRRPPLSKTFLSGEATSESLLIRNAETYAKQDIEFLGEARVRRIDRPEKTIELEDGQVIGYSKLVLATGGRPRRLSLPGAEKTNVHYVRTIADVEALREDFLPGRRLAVIGGGYIGLETAAVGIKKGLKVTVLEALPRVLARVAAPELSAFYARAHRSRGVDVRTGVKIQALLGAGRVEEILFEDGTRMEADLVIAGIGLIPNAELAASAGLRVENGIVVDAHSRTSDPDILAAGDVAQHENAFLGRSMRLESVPSAQEQARTAALTICGKPVPHAAVPWFWSDQYDLKLQMVGLSEGYDRFVTRGDISSDSFSAFYLRNDTVICAECVNRPQDFAMAKKLVAARAAVLSAALADESLPLKNLIPA
ncbi:MAG TPA: FAD-dependent oxidoreductase [Solimonas sp.]|nr:FAD-dependent oxidoreductase [Solimonas sp.]